MSDKTNKTNQDQRQGGSKPPIKPSILKELGGTEGPDPARYGDWQHKGRCSDF